MKLIVTAIFAFCLFALPTFAQNLLTIKGVTIDSASKAKLNTSVSILNAKDSVLRQFTYANDNGAFTVSGLSAGKYFLLITYPGYTDKIHPFVLNAAQLVADAGNINMSLIPKQLAEVIIKGAAQEIKIKGDTLEFNAKAYVIQPNDKVEDLLKKIPGIEIDKNGKITMQGQPISKVLVDGEEFFGDDPTLVTQNLRADMVDKVQVFDKKSDQAAFTGIDDGQKTKTINIKLKEDKKRGYFGKVSGGLGTDNYNEAQAIFNKFTARSKFAAYGTLANDGKTGLGIADNSKIGTSNGVQIGDTGGLIVSGSGDDDLDAFNGNYSGNGLPTARAGGVHYDTKIRNDATLNANYKIGSLDVVGNFNSLSQVTIPGSKQSTQVNRNFENQAFRQSANLTYQTKLDTSSTLKIDVNALDKNSKTYNNGTTTIQDEAGNLLTREIKRNTTDQHQKSFNISALYTKKFKKPSRTFSWNLSETYSESNSTGYLFSDVYSPNKLPTDTVTDQYKPVMAHNNTFSSNMTYTEPLTKYWALQFNYGLGVSNTINDRESYDKTVSGLYDKFNTIYSNDFKIDQVTNQLGGIFNYKKAKTLLNFGARASIVDFDQVERFTGQTFNRSFVNWNPQARYQYNLSTSKIFQIDYRGNMNQPTPDQLQPVLVNTNPLNVTIGNPDLKASFNHNLQVVYQSQQIISRQSLLFLGNFSLTGNPIINRSIIDPLTGKTTTQSVNLIGNTPYNYNLVTQAGRRITGTEIDAALGISINGNTNYSYINNDLNKLDRTNLQLTFQMQTAKAKKYDLGVRFSPNYSIVKNSLLPQSNNNAVGAIVNARGLLYLPGKLILSSDVNYNYTAKTQNIDAINMTILNASLSKTFLKDNNLKLSLAGNNLLNTNTTLIRNITATSITQSSYNTILRYFMVAISWDFTKFGTAAVKN